jgi:hypothetical protein
MRRDGMSKTSDRKARDQDRQWWDPGRSGWGTGRSFGTQADDQLSGSAGKDKIYGLGGNDTLIFVSKEEELYILDRDGSGQIEIEHYLRALPDLTVNGASLAALLDGARGGGAGRDVFGTDFSERLYGTVGDDFIDARGGHDRVDAGALRTAR